MRAEKWRKGSRMSTLGNRVWEEWGPSLDTVVLGRGALFCSSVTLETIFRYIAIQRYIYATGISSHGDGLQTQALLTPELKAQTTMQVCLPGEPSPQGLLGTLLQLCLISC